VPYETIRYETIEDHVVLITLNRPERLNALNRTLFEELGDAIQRIEEDDDVRVFMVTGAPRPDGRPVFSAGADLKSSEERGPTPHWLANEVIDRIDDMLKPSIAVVDGICTTGAGELAWACDLRVAAETAQFSDWHLKTTGAGIGGWGAATRLTRLVGVDKAKEMLLTGCVIDGVEAKQIGLVNRVYPSERLMEGALEMARAIVGMRPDGVRLTLGFLEHQIDMDKHQALHWAGRVDEVMGISRSSDRFDAIQRGEGTFKE